MGENAIARDESEGVTSRQITLVTGISPNIVFEALKEGSRKNVPMLQGVASAATDF